MSTAKGFVPFPAQRGRSTRGRSWWARAWVQAMEDTSLDNNQLKKGRRFANSGQVGTITVSPGRIAALVEAPEDRYESAVLVEQLTDDEWSRFLDEVGSRAGHIAALLDGDMPHDLVSAAEDAGVQLLPGIGDLDPSCTCDAWELPCQHAAGLSYQVAWLLDDDPFVLLLLRGRSREDLLDELQRRAMEETLAPTSEIQQEVSVDAATVFAAQVGVLPASPELPGKVSLEDLPITGTAPLESVLLPLLVLDAARRARGLLNALLAGASEPWELDEWQDSVRLAAEYPELRDRLAGTERLAVGVQAWEYGGAPGLDVLLNAWAPQGGELVRARTELQAANDEDIDLEISGNWLTASTVQLRLDRVGRWHPYRLVDDEWLPAGPADRDPTAAFAGQ
ncbi:SWIM zinc finger family protein [Kribbella sp. NPDC051770]|uniref:SWIM zinc finger family protein n=1 Tax=Kribbella sp. NPDC051770 TaxID=3155413 RepID=UPI00343E9ED1